MRRLALNLATSVSACLYEAIFVSLLMPQQVDARRSFLASGWNHCTQDFPCLFATPVFALLVFVAAARRRVSSVTTGRIF